MATPNSPTWELPPEGEGPPPFRVGPLTRTDFVRYQGASGDMNPIHHDEEFARAAGFSAPVCVGMLQASAMQAWAAGFFGPENVRRVVMRWQEPLFPGDEVVFTATVSRRYDEAGERRVDVDLVGKKPSGTVAVSGSATYVVP